MTELAYFDADADRQEIVTALREDGACVLVDVMDSALKSRVKEELRPFMDATTSQGGLLLEQARWLREAKRLENS